MQERRRDCASALIVANVAGQDGQAVAQRRRGDDQIGLRERMPCLAAFLDQQPPESPTGHAHIAVDAHDELTSQMDRSVGAGQALDCFVAIRGAGPSHTGKVNIRFMGVGGQDLCFPCRLAFS